MNHRTIFALGFLISTSTVLAASVGAASSVDWPTRWRVNGSGVTGTLEFTVNEEGNLNGRLLDEPIEGFVSGRRLLILRNAGGRAEVWEGWLAEPRAAGEPATSTDSDLFVAGTFSVSDAGQTRVHPWYGIPETVASSTADSPAAPPPSAAHAPPPVVTASPPLPLPLASAGTLSGTWTSVTGERAKIVQDGKTLTVILADGSLHSGRMTGSSTLVVGLRQGCCNGKLEGPNVIVWSDGARWHRAN